MYDQLHCEDRGFGVELNRDGNRVDQIQDNSFSLLKTALMQPLRAGHHDAVRKHDRSQLLNIVRQAIGPSTDERQCFSSPTQGQRPSGTHPQ